MTTYEELINGINLSQLPAELATQDEAIRTLERGQPEPSVKPEGLLHQSTDLPRITAAGLPGVSEAILRYNAVSDQWEALLDVRQVQVNAGGTVAFSAPQSMGGNRMTNLATSSAAADAVRQDQVLLRDGSQAMAGDLSLSGFKITNLQAGSGPNDAVTKAYVDNAVGGLQTNRHLIVGGPPTSGVLMIGARNGTWKASVFRTATGPGSFSLNGHALDSTKLGTLGEVAMFFVVADNQIVIEDPSNTVSYLMCEHWLD